MTFLTRRPPPRFSLLIAEDGEHYVTECLAALESFYDGKPSGTLHVCTKSLYFEPEDPSLPVVRIPFTAASSLECNQSLNTMSISTSVFVLMKPDGLDVPYKFVKERRDVSVTFRLAYAHVVDIHSHAQQMLALSRLPPNEAWSFQEMFMEGIEKSSRFDRGLLLEPFSEKVLVEVDAMMLSQMCKERGKFVIGDLGVYFQPLHDVHGRGRAEAAPDLLGVLRRRRAQMEVALEIVFRGRQSWFVVFRSTEEREVACKAIWSRLSSLSGPAPVFDTLHHDSQLSKATRAWQRGAITNFEYLIYCNVASGRSFDDLAQYPVFPWVITDYESEELDLSDPVHFRDLSKPVGALNPKRRETFHRRYREMMQIHEDTTGGHDGHNDHHHHRGQHAFMYGTHYSCPAYVLFWLVRQMPAHQLRLQGGKFDAPDRLFHSVHESFVSVYNSTGDVKELIPEMYGTDASFLRNERCLPLGRRQNGMPVADVEVPPWASSPEEFLSVQRAALESDYVSSNLNHWIDLIFGVHQQSIDKDNLFRAPHEGERITLTPSTTAEEAAAQAKLVLEVEEFGTCPRQIFFDEHPTRDENRESGARTSDDKAAFSGLSADISAMMTQLCTYRM